MPEAELRLALHRARPRRAGPAPCGPARAAPARPRVGRDRPSPPAPRPRTPCPRPTRPGAGSCARPRACRVGPRSAPAPCRARAPPTASAGCRSSSGSDRAAPHELLGVERVAARPFEQRVAASPPAARVARSSDDDELRRLVVGQRGERLIVVALREPRAQAGWRSYSSGRAVQTNEQRDALAPSRRGARESRAARSSAQCRSSNTSTAGPLSADRLEEPAPGGERLLLRRGRRRSADAAAPAAPNQPRSRSSVGQRPLELRRCLLRASPTPGCPPPPSRSRRAPRR